MRRKRHIRFQLGGIFLATFCLLDLSARGQAPVVVSTNITVRLVAANLTSGNFARYETPGLNILKGLKPDIVAIQEFNISNSFGINTPSAIRATIDDTFGTNFVYFRESSATENYTIPNGIISRYPIIASGSWDDVTIPDRGFAWAQIDLPGANDLYVVSVHLKASSGSASQRAIESTNLTTLIQANFPTNAWLVVAGDFNIHSSSEVALAKFKTYLSDSPIPTDGFSNASTNLNTNQPRSQRYDYVLPSFSFATNLTNVVIGSRTFTNGLVFDSRIYTPLSEVAPVISTDSDASGMQHMAVVKDFRIHFTVTNFVAVPPPALILDSTNVVRWHGLSNVAYSVQASTNLPGFVTIGSAISTTTNFSFTNSATNSQLFYRVIYP